MNFAMKTGAIAALAMTVAGAANAAVTITNVLGDTVPAGYTVIADFDSPIAAGYTLPGADVRTVSSGDAAQPPGDGSAFLAVLGGKSVTLTSISGFKGFSFYMGSPDSYNWISIDGGPAIYGAALLGNPVEATNGDQSLGYTVKYDLGGAVAHTVTFASDQNSFEIDKIATAAVPEPATWALMIGGFGTAGMALRQRRRVLA